MNKEEFIIELSKIGIILTKAQLEQLDIFYNLVLEWNDKMNLTGITDEPSFYLKHFFDSLTLNKVVALDGEMSLCDVGSGAGFPGIVLKIVFPRLKITLVDSLNKRVKYLNEVIRIMKLSSIIAVHERMEDFSMKNEEGFDIITARAVANLSVLAFISVRALKVDGSMIFMKAKADDEIEEFLTLGDDMGLKLDVVDKFLLPIENSSRTLIKIDKFKRTEKSFPRDINKLRKKAL